MVSFLQVPPAKTCIQSSFLPYMPHDTPYPSQVSWFYDLSNIWWTATIIQFLIMQSSSLFHYLVTLMTRYLPQHPIIQARVLPSLWETKLHTPTKQATLYSWFCIF
jgi:hypothetical protein